MSSARFEFPGCNIDKKSSNKENINLLNKQPNIGEAVPLSLKTFHNPQKNIPKTTNNVFERLYLSKKLNLAKTKSNNKQVPASTRQSLNFVKNTNNQNSNPLGLEKQRIKKDLNIEIQKKEPAIYKTLNPQTSKNINENKKTYDFSWNSTRKFSQIASYEAFQAKLYENILDH